MHKDLFVGLNALFLFVRLNALNTFFPVHLLFQLTRTTNMVEFQNKELKKRTRCIKLFPNKESLLRIATALLIELDETWLSESKRYI